MMTGASERFLIAMLIALVVLYMPDRVRELLAERAQLQRDVDDQEQEQIRRFLAAR